MKTWIKRGLIGLSVLVGTLLIALGALVGYGQIAFGRGHERDIYPIVADTSPEGIARGKYLVTSVSSCTGCHAEKIGGPLIGSYEKVALGPVRAARTVALLPFVPPATDPSEDRARWLAELDGDPPPSPARRGWLEACRAWADRFPRPEGGVTAVDVVCWALGDLRVAWFPGEVFVEQALELAAAVPETVVCVSNANAAPGYVPHPSEYAAGGYEVEEAFRFYGAPGPFTPDASRRLGAAMLGLLAELRR